MDTKRRKEEGTAVSEFLSSGTWTEIIKPILQRMMADGFLAANENVDSHGKMIQGLTRANTLAEFESALESKAKDRDIDLDSPAATGPEISQDE
jgi:phosphoserine phosphatase